MNGAELLKLLDERISVSLETTKVVVQQGEGEVKEVVGVRLITELGEGDAEGLLVLRLRPSTRGSWGGRREEIGKEKEEAAKKLPRTKAVADLSEPVVAAEK
jgi:hypothetical protein